MADVDGDGLVDLLWGAGWTDTGPDYLYVANTTGDHAIKWHNVDLGGPFLGPVIGDLDGDGKPELVACSFFSELDYASGRSGRILVFDLATLTLRGISQPVVDNEAGTGVHDLKLRDLDGNGRMEIVIGSDYRYDGVVEIYSFDSLNTFRRTWTNATRPVGSPFNFVEAVDLDGNGTRKILAGNYEETTGSPGVYLYIYDYPSGRNSWKSVNMHKDYHGFNGITGLVVNDLDGNGSKEIAVLAGSHDLYTFNGASRALESLVKTTPFTSLDSESNSYGLIAGDDAGKGHFLRYAKPGYTETLTLQLASGYLDGINSFSDGELWTGSGGVLTLRLPPSYSTVTWQSPALGANVGRFVATEVRDFQKCVFTSTQHALFGLSYATIPPGHLRNISTRLQVLNGNNVMIGGFTVDGSTSKNVLLRALGPTLTQFGVTGVLADPTLQLFNGSGNPMWFNDNWKDTQQAGIQASGLVPANDVESAIRISLPPGNYTAILRGKNNSTGTALLETYDVDQSTTATLTNISTRGFVETGQNAMIGGFIPSNGPVKVIVRVGADAFRI